MSEGNPFLQGRSLGSTAASSAVYVALSQGFRLTLTTLSTVVVSRLLLPDDYGVVAMVSPVVAFILMFQDFGLSQATIQASEITQEQNSSLFWLNMLASILLTLILVVMSPLIGIFYNDARSGWLAAAFAINIIIAGASLQHSALLNRNMRFGRIAMIDMVNVAANFIVTLGAALMLRSFWAIWLGTLAATSASSIMFWSSSGFRPRLRPRLEGIGRMARFGGNVGGFNLINFFSRNADNVLIAKFSGSAQLGLYDRSYKLLMLPLQNISAPLSKVMLPTLRRAIHNPEAYRRAYLTAVRLIMLLTVPGVAVTVATSNEVIAFLLGDRWVAAGPIFFWLSLVGLIQPLLNATGWLFISSGRVHEQFRWGIFSTITTVLGFCVGLRWGAEGVAAAWLITNVVRMPLLLYYSSRGSSVTNFDLYRSMFEPLTAAGLTVTILVMARGLLPIGPFLLCGLLLSYALAVSALMVTKGGRNLLSTFRRLATGALAPAIDKVGRFRRADRNRR